MSVRAVLFDVGGPIDTEVLHEALVDAHLIRALLSVGVNASEPAFEAANTWAVQSYAPDAYAAILWRLCRGDRLRAREAQRLFAESSVERRETRGGLELRPGIEALLTSLHQRGVLLGLAANQPAQALDDLDRLGLGRYFSHREVSGHHGYRKPDTRLFLRACEDLDVAPEQCIMVGDRIDNDIFPARALGMATVLFRTGRHMEQQPRSLQEVPDAEVHSVSELVTALDQLIASH
ncbi:HAD family hydrolase [Candidatus Amarobacter glycogenicus]|uniref:HAD family hydrolase n=1 Tax=Candidatus Amarobacter glycogenicus TaxID=3140699 RepID=UPI0031362990|nr:HAD family hydrolase [Dehalococcoidia bacterium]